MVLAVGVGALVGMLLGLGIGLEIINIRRRRRDRRRALYPWPGKANFWADVFARSPVNGGPYRGGDLPAAVWNWPKETFLQRSLKRRGQEKQEK